MYVYLPDDAISDPILLREAAEEFAHVMSMSPVVSKFAPPGDELFAAWLWVRSGLVSGVLDAYAQTRLSRRWARIPRAYWDNLDPLNDPPETLDQSDDAELRGQPIVVKREGLSPLLSIFWDMSRVMAGKGELPPVDAKRAVAARANPVSEPELSDWFINVRVPAIADGRIPTWQQCWDAAQEYFQGRWVTRDRLQVVRGKVCPDTWRKPGPRG